MLAKPTVTSSPKTAKAAAKVLSQSKLEIINEKMEEENPLMGEVLFLREETAKKELLITQLTIQLQDYEQLSVRAQEHEELLARHERLQGRVAQLEEKLGRMTAIEAKLSQYEQLMSERETQFPTLAPKINWNKIDQSTASPTITNSTPREGPKNNPTKKRIKIDSEIQLKLVIEGKPMRNTKLSFVYMKAQRQKIRNIKAALDFIGIARRPVRHITFVGPNLVELCVFEECKQEIAEKLKEKGCTVYPLETNPGNVHLLPETNDGKNVSIQEAVKSAKQRIAKEIEAVKERRKDLKTQLNLSEENGILTGVLNAYSANAKMVEMEEKLLNNDGRGAH